MTLTDRDGASERDKERESEGGRNGREGALGEGRGYESAFVHLLSRARPPRSHRWCTLGVVHPRDLPSVFAFQGY